MDECQKPRALGPPHLSDFDLETIDFWVWLRIGQHLLLHVNNCVSASQQTDLCNI